MKRDRDIGRKAVLSDVKTAFTLTPALRRKSNNLARNLNNLLRIGTTAKSVHFWKTVLRDKLSASVLQEVWVVSVINSDCVKTRVIEDLPHYKTYTLLPSRDQKNVSTHKMRFFLKS